MNDIIISLKNIRKSFLREKGGDSPNFVLKGLDLEVRKGEFISIHGKSGSGKTTLLNITAGLMEPDAGLVKFEGKNLYSLSDYKRSFIRNRKMGFIFQQFFLIPAIKVRENIMLPGVIAKIGKKELMKRIDEVLEILDLKHLAEYYPFTLSGGQQQRVAIGRAILMKPAVLLCDEPIANLDPESSEKIVSIFKNLSLNEKVAIIVVSHQHSIDNVADTRYLLKDGKLEKC